MSIRQWLVILLTTLTWFLQEKFNLYCYEFYAFWLIKKSFPYPITFMRILIPNPLPVSYHFSLLFVNSSMDYLSTVVMALQQWLTDKQIKLPMNTGILFYVSSLVCGSQDLRSKLWEIYLDAKSQFIRV